MSGACLSSYVLVFHENNKIQIRLSFLYSTIVFAFVAWMMHSPMCLYQTHPDVSKICFFEKIVRGGSLVPNSLLH